MPTFFVASEDVTPPTIRISGSLLHHLHSSLRLQAGDPLTVTDPRGIRYRSEVINVTASAIESRILETTTAPSRTSPSLVLVQALVKGEKMDWVIQKATELGVDAIVPVHTRRAVVKVHRDRVEHQWARWQRIALEAAQQSERWTILMIEHPTDLADSFQRYASASTKCILAERSAGFSLATIPLPVAPEQSVVIAIGPEGGWDAEELHAAEKQGWHAVTLGTRILRAETAAVAAISILQSRLGELG
jgi:16S rRNA (uracil1498-N3)-methyltransferase